MLRPIPDMIEYDVQMPQEPFAYRWTLRTTAKLPQTKPEFEVESDLRTDLLSEKRFLIPPETFQLSNGFHSPPKPWLAPQLRAKLDRMKKTPLKKNEMVDFIEDIANVCVEFYQIEEGKSIAARFDGRIVESADTQIELLLRIQGKDFGMPIFAWEVGSESFSGWRI